MKLTHTLITLATAFGLTNELTAQVDLTNTGILYITGASDLVYINGSFTNASGSALTNNGVLHLTGNLANSQAGMSPGTGTLNLFGTSQQQVTGAQVFRTNHLNTNNPAGFLLNNDLSVGGVHTFSAGNIVTSLTPNYLIYEAGSSYTGDDDTRHVNGWVRKTGTTAFSFPVGNGTVERKIAITNLSASSIFNARYAGATTNTGNVASPLFTVDPNEYWQLNRVSGGTANVNLNWDNSKVNMPNYAVPDIRVANYISGNWTQVGGVATGTTATTGTITSNTISSFGSFTLGSVSVILPVRLVQFSAAKLSTGVALKWLTVDEVNVDHHEPQRSDDGIVFTKIGAVDAKNMQGIQGYEFLDTRPLSPVTYYRLKSVDKDGKSSLSKIITISAGDVTNTGLAIVNPAYKTIHGITTSMAGTYQYQLSTLSGQSVQQGSVVITSAGLNIPISGSVTKGMYLLRIQKPGFNIVRKVMIER